MPIILLFFNDTKKLIIHENSDEIFNRGIVNVLLEPYEELKGIHYTYDDISTMIINDDNRAFIGDNDDDTHQYLPNGLKKLHIQRSCLVQLPKFPLSIEKIIIGSSFIQMREDFTHYTNLKQLEIGVMSDLGSIYPANLYKKITKIQESERELYFNRRIVHQNNRPMPDVLYRDYRDGTYRHAVPLEPDANKLAHLVNNGQSVHISSINKAICKSITLINELAEKHPPVKNPLDYIIKPKTKNVFKRAYHYVRNIFINDITINDSNTTIQGWFASGEIHSLHQITFAQLFEKVVRIIIHHEHKEGLIERLREELTEAMGLCFTGRMNRLVNSLSGIVEGIKVSFSIEEQIQLESQKIIERLNTKTITLEKAKEEMLEIFNDEEIKKDDSLMRLKEDYVNALDDFVDDDTTTF